MWGKDVLFCHCLQHTFVVNGSSWASSEVFISSLNLFLPESCACRSMTFPSVLCHAWNTDENWIKNDNHNSIMTVNLLPLVHQLMVCILFCLKTNKQTKLVFNEHEKYVISVGQIYPYRGAIYTTSQVQPMLHSAWIGHRLLHLHYLWLDQTWVRSLTSLSVCYTSKPQPCIPESRRCIMD